MCACIFTIFSFLSQASLAEARVGGGLLHSQGHWVQQCMYGTCWRRCHYLHYLHHSLASGQTTGREQSPTHQQKIGLKIYWSWPCPSEQDPVSPSVSLSHHEVSIRLILIHQRAGRLKISITENKPNWSHGPQTCLTQWNYEWAMLWRAIQDRQVMLERSDKTWSTGEEKGKPLQYSCLKNPMNSMKRQKDRTLKDELPRWVGVQYATRDRWRNKSRKNEETEPKQKHLTMDVTGDGSQDQGCKEQYCIGTWNIRSMNQGKFEAVKQKMARVNTDILGISELKWTGLWFSP